MKGVVSGVVLSIFVVVAAATVPALGNQYALGLAFNLAMWIALTQSWSMLSATTGYVSLGHVVFYGLGTYVLILVLPVLPLWASLAASAAAAAVFALAVGLPVLRVHGPYFVILTYGLAELVKNVVVRIETFQGQFSRMIFDSPDLDTLYFYMLGCAVAATLVTYWIGHSHLGYGLRAIREDETAAEAVGVPVARLKLAAYAASAAIPGIVGGLVVLRVGYFEPTQAFDPAISFTIVTMVIVGGSEDIRGPLLGAVGFLLLSEILWTRLPQLYMIILGIALIVFIPHGLAGFTDKLGRKP
jgi:branched-chain amino acid transport system permease protein